MGLINEIISDKKEYEKPLKDEHGFLYYKNLPNNTRQVTKDDFLSGLFVKGTRYIVHSYIYECYWCCIVNRGIPDWLTEFIEGGRVYVFV